MPEFNFNLEWSDGYLYLTEADGSGCRWECKTPEKAGWREAGQGDLSRILFNYCKAG